MEELPFNPNVSGLTWKPEMEPRILALFQVPARGSRENSI
jgi:hypothetical protein